MRHKYFAFSLIELLVALAILAVVTALVLPKFLDVRKQSVLAVADKNLAELNAVYQQWYTLGGRPNGASASEVVAFLGTAPASSSSLRKLNGSAFPHCTDTLGSFGSTSVTLAGGLTVTNRAELDDDYGNGKTVPTLLGYYYSGGNWGDTVVMSYASYFWHVLFNENLTSGPFYFREGYEAKTINYMNG